MSKSGEPEPDALFLFRNNDGDFLSGIVLAWIEANGKFFVSAKTTAVQPLTDLISPQYPLLKHSRSFPGYCFQKGEVVFSSSVTIISEDRIFRKAVMIPTEILTFFVPLLSQFEHN